MGVKEKSFYIQHVTKQPSHFYNRNRLHDTTVFQIVEKYLTLLSNITFGHHFYNAVLCSLQRCVTLRFCTEVMDRST